MKVCPDSFRHISSHFCPLSFVLCRLSFVVCAASFSFLACNPIHPPCSVRSHTALRRLQSSPQGRTRSSACPPHSRTRSHPLPYEGVQDHIPALLPRGGEGHGVGVQWHHGSAGTSSPEPGIQLRVEPGNGHALEPHPGSQSRTILAPVGRGGGGQTQLIDPGPAPTHTADQSGYQGVRHHWALFLAAQNVRFCF